MLPPLLGHRIAFGCRQGYAHAGRTDASQRRLGAAPADGRRVPGPVPRDCGASKDSLGAALRFVCGEDTCAPGTEVHRSQLSICNVVVPTPAQHCKIARAQDTEGQGARGQWRQHGRRGRPPRVRGPCGRRIGSGCNRTGGSRDGRGAGGRGPRGDGRGRCHRGHGHTDAPDPGRRRHAVCTAARLCRGRVAAARHLHGGVPAGRGRQARHRLGSVLGRAL